jgi:transaldolase
MPVAPPASSPAAPTTQLHQLGQSLWLDNITRGLLDDGTLADWIGSLSVTGLTSNPSIYHNAIKQADFYDAAIAEKLGRGLVGEELFFALAIEDLQRAADLFRPVHEATGGLDGWVSLEVSPLLAYDTDATIESARKLHGQAGRDNLFIKIPGTPAGLPAIEEAIAAGVPVNVTLLFTVEQYLAAAEAYLRGIERRLDAGLPPRVCSVASLFISRWDTPTADTLPRHLKNCLGIAIGTKAYAAYRSLLASDRFARLANFGVLPQRLLFASTGTKDPEASDVLYAESLAAPHTINTMPEKTLRAFADHGRSPAALSADGGNAEQTLHEITAAGVDIPALGDRLQREGAEAFVKSWHDLLAVIGAKA